MQGLKMIEVPVTIAELRYFKRADSVVVDEFVGADFDGADEDGMVSVELADDQMIHWLFSLIIESPTYVPDDVMLTLMKTKEMLSSYHYTTLHRFVVRTNQLYLVVS